MPAGLAPPRHSEALGFILSTPAPGRHPGSERRDRNEAEPVGLVTSPPLTLILWP